MIAVFIWGCLCAYRAESTCVCIVYNVPVLALVSEILAVISLSVSSVLTVSKWCWQHVNSVSETFTVLSV